MAMQILNYTESPLNFEKSKKYHKNSNLKSFWAFMLSIFIYISIFYVFNLSPSTLFYTTKFWFIISNTLILIIAADFSASKYYNFHDEYRKNNTRAKSVTFDQIQYVKIVDEKQMPIYHNEEVYDQTPREKIISVVENKPEKFIITNEEKDDHELAGETNEKLDIKKRKVIINNLNTEAKIEAREVKKRQAKCVRFNSEKKQANFTSENKEKLVLQKTLSERDDHIEETRLEEDEFSRMSNEELNRRVEEFIRRFNRQIRLDRAAANRSRNME